MKKTLIILGILIIWMIMFVFGAMVYDIDTEKFELHEYGIYIALFLISCFLSCIVLTRLKK